MRECEPEEITFRDLEVCSPTCSQKEAEELLKNSNESKYARKATVHNLSSFHFNITAFSMQEATARLSHSEARELGLWLLKHTEE